tara:strand:+ start:181 stop:987 length:807 start_codon:yes stop_codon:yes gene_type:complete
MFIQNIMENEDGPKIMPVQDRDDLPKEKPLHPNLPKPPVLMVLNSPIRTGKSTIISNIYLSDHFYGQDYFDQVHVLSPTIHNDDTSRFLLKFADCYDGYSDQVIDDIIAHQNKYEKKDMPSISICLDDCLGTIRREAKINHLASRFRHYNIKLLMISSQKFRHVSPVIRTNATCVIVGSPYPNQQELDKIFFEYGDQFGGYDNIKKIYKMATPERYNFMMLNLAENPPLAYKNFETLIAKGPQIIGENLNNNVEIQDLKKDDNIKNVL